MHFSFCRHTKPLKGMNFGHFYRLKCSSVHVLLHVDVYPKIYHGKVLFLMVNYFFRVFFLETSERVTLT